MPMYQYKCDECDHMHEKLQKIGEDAPACPKCSSAKQTKQLSANTGFCLMGYGWTKNGMSVSSKR